MKNEQTIMGEKLNELFDDHGFAIQEQLIAICNQLEFIEDGLEDLVDKKELFPLENTPSENISNAVDNLRSALRVIKRLGL